MHLLKGSVPLIESQSKVAPENKAELIPSETRILLFLLFQNEKMYWKGVNIFLFYNQSVVHYMLTLTIS